MQGAVRTVLLILSGLLNSPTALYADAIPVQLKQSAQGWQLFRDGEPYLIRGAGGNASLELLAAAGANSVRTWSADDVGPLLDQAHALGLSVTVGIWLGHERHGFDYHDKVSVREQLDKARETVLRYKDHPAVLLWGIGNEMEGFASGDNPVIWNAVNDVAAMVKQLDPNHPTMTVTAELGGGRIDSVHKHAPAIDIHGVNSYGGAASVAQRLRAGGATKPYVLTEFGPVGAWEMPTTDWGAPYEQTSTEKARFYRKSYAMGVLGATGQALGSYAFLWGHKMEGTDTWMGMFLQDGSPLGVLDVMTELWSGEAPSVLAPTVEPLLVSGKTKVQPEAEVNVKAIVTDPQNSPAKVRWVLRPESNEYATGGDFRQNLPDIENAIIQSRVDGARVRMPQEPGPYRLFLYAKNSSGRAATANVPLLVLGKPRPRMPIDVYQDSLEGMPWVPSGWMGGVDFLSLDGTSAENPYHGAASIKLRYEGKYGWVGVAWQNPANNWGDQAGGYDLTGATALELWARGEYGGEKISLGVGIIGEDKPHPDSGRTKLDDIVLTDQWQHYRVPVHKLDLSSIKTGFYVILNGRSSPVTVYLDSIRFIR